MSEPSPLRSIATDSATGSATASLKALATSVIERNRQRNQGATKQLQAPVAAAAPAQALHVPGTQARPEPSAVPSGSPPTKAAPQSELERLVSTYRALLRRLDTPELGMPHGDAARRLMDLGARIRRLSPGFDLMVVQLEEGAAPMLEPVPVAPGKPAGACRACGGLERWKAKGDRQSWKCGRCHPPARPDAVEWERLELDAAASVWDSEADWLIDWLATAPIPSEPFTLSSGQRVSDPARFVARLRADARHGPDGPRARSGALQDDVRAFYRLVNGEAAGARPGSEE